LSAKARAWINAVPNAAAEDEPELAAQRLLIDGLTNRGRAKRAPKGYSERDLAERLGITRDRLHARKIDLAGMLEFALALAGEPGNLPSVPLRRRSRVKGNHSTYR